MSQAVDRTIAQMKPLSESPLRQEVMDKAALQEKQDREQLARNAGVEHPSETSTMARAAQMVTILVAITASAYFARSVVIPILLALIASMALNPPNAWLKRRLPAPIAAALVVALLVIPGGTAAYYLGLPAVEWVKSAPEKLPQLRDRFRHILGPAARLSEAASSVSSIADSDDKSRKNSSVEIKDNHVASSVVFWTGSFLASVGETLALLFLMLASGQDLMRNFVRVLPTIRDRKRAVDVVQEIQHSISNYLFAVSLINLGFGVAVGASLYSLGMPAAIMWGGVAMFLNFIPFFGPIAGILAVGMAGILAFDTLGHGLLPMGAYLVLHLIESNIVTPFTIGRQSTLNPISIFVALIFFSWLWGVVGGFLALPMLVIAKAIFDRVPSLNHWAVILSNSRHGSANRHLEARGASL